MLITGKQVKKIEFYGSLRELRRKFVEGTKQRQSIAPFCPCGAHDNRDGKFAPFRDDDSGKHGHCFSCGKSFFQDSPNQNAGTMPAIEQKHVTYIDRKHVINSMNGYNKNNLALFFMQIFGKPLAQFIIAQYFLGTSKEGNAVFWQIDEAMKARQCKMMKYGTDGKRDRATTPFHMGKRLVPEDSHLLVCMFGQHLLADMPDATVNIVESEKTAMMMTAMQFHHFINRKQIWLATGGAQGARLDTQTCLKGRNVVLWPDEDKLEEWVEKGDTIKSLIKANTVQVNDFCRRKGVEKSDIADFIEIADGMAMFDGEWIADVFPFKQTTL